MPRPRLVGTGARSRQPLGLRRRSTARHDQTSPGDGAQPPALAHSCTDRVDHTAAHVITERDQVEASARRREHDELAFAERERHLAAIAAKLARQQALTPPAVKLVGREARGYVGVRDATPEWAMGVPLFVHDMPQGVISPVVSRVSAEVLARLRGLTLFVATKASGVPSHARAGPRNGSCCSRWKSRPSRGRRR